MGAHVRAMDELFSAAKAEFKHLEHYYFHNCLYEGVWRDNRRRRDEQIATSDVINRYGSDYKCIFVGDAAMSPYEISHPGGANEHWNPESGAAWLGRACAQWPANAWLNPTPERYWPHTPSIRMIGEVFSGRMFPLTLAGITAAMKVLV